ncbi:MAG: selenide, water dikinase SelD [Bacteroidales bacterium]|nr:selenide, water dikinase SelD [Bacteroidales bacterium]
MDKVRLTQYSHGAGCGCKISPKLLTSILKTNMAAINDPRLLVGNDSRDDAAVYDLGNGTAIISTTDFFMPIVDDPFTFGKIAATNAISDVYAMGGTPMMAIAILGWPIDKLSCEIAQEVLDGGRAACKEAGISIAGGHSIDSPEPIFGLAVTGSIEVKKLKQNNTATPGCSLYLTKPLGIGILTTAQKRGILKPEHSDIAPHYMCILNKAGLELAGLNSVKAMTDVTGFGLIGHLSEMCEGSNVSAQINYNKIPKLPMLDEYIAQKSMPGGTRNNWDSYGQQVKLTDPSYRYVLCDPQTSGGLLIAVEEDGKDEVEKILKNNGLEAEVFGKTMNRGKVLIEVK